MLFTRLPLNLIGLNYYDRFTARRMLGARRCELFSNNLNNCPHLLKFLSDLHQNGTVD